MSIVSENAQSRTASATTPGSPEGPLTEYLRSWLHLLTTGEDRTVLHRIFEYCRTSKVFLAVNVYCMLLAIWDTFLSGQTPAGQAAGRLVLSFYACNWPQYAFAFRTPLFCRSVAILLDLTSKVERIGTHPASLNRMKLTVKRMKFLSHSYGLCLSLADAGGLLTMILVEPMWHKATASGVVGARNALAGTGFAEDDEALVASIVRWSTLFPQFVALISCTSTYIVLIILTFTVYSAASDTSDAIGRALQVEPCTPYWAEMQSSVLQVLLLMDEAISDLLPHVLIGVVVIPLLSTVEVVSHGLDTDPFALVMVTWVLNLFVPLCLIGDGLTSARKGVSKRAGLGPWLEEDLQGRRLRLSVMHAAIGRGAPLRGRGIGALNRRTCMNALKSWVSFLQVLINIQTRKPPQASLLL